jgi:2-polyprenyl-3-methyl-5-hydroxy-6-metoxy-1,4-benzoquinol methylase
MDAVLDRYAGRETCDAMLSVALPASAEARADHQVRTSLELLSELYNYNHWIFNKVRPFIRGRVCEIGCGTGNITQFLLNCDQVVGLEPQVDSYREVEARFRPHANVRFANCCLEDVPSESVPSRAFDTVVCLNVLEHIEDDADSLRRMRSLCGRRGRVVLLVPAHMSIYGELDRSFGHHRRYNRRSLAGACTRAGLEPVHSFYMNSIGYLGWWWYACIRKRQQLPLEGSRVFNRIVPFLDALERVLRLPFGQSLVMVSTPMAGRS